MKKSGKIILSLAFVFLTFAAASQASAASSPAPVSADEAKYLELKQGAMAPGAMDIAPTPMTASEADMMAGMESASGLDPDSITAGSSMIDLIIVILLVYLILRLLD